MRDTFLKIVRTDGFHTLYNGISASLLRQLIYSTVRFGIYEELKQSAGGPDPTFAFLSAIAASSGFAGGLAGNVADVVNVRMQHDAALPTHQQRKYKHAIDGMMCMAKEEGIRSWFRGWLPNSSRAAVTTVSQLASYDVAKRLLITHTPMEDTISTQVMASFLAGLTAATVTSPIDVIKTRIMSSTGSRGVADVVREIMRTEGAGWMFKGWVPSFLRQGP
jgi:dicarboxylate transporter 10